MRLLPRRPADPALEDPIEPDAESVESSGATKGRPTPKRRDSAPRRGPAAPAPKTRREAMARQRQQAKTAKTSGTAISARERRERMMAGDPDYLLRKDAGPLKALARDYVDSRRMLSNGLLILLPILLLAPLLRSSVVIVDLALIACLLVVLVEWYVTGRRLLAMAHSRDIPIGRTSPFSLGFYAGNRAFMPRKWRAPRPRVNLHDPI